MCTLQLKREIGGLTMLQEFKREFITWMCRMLKSGYDLQGVIIGRRWIALKWLVCTVNAFNLFSFAPFTTLLYRTYTAGADPGI